MEILPQLLVNALITGSIYALATSGLSLTYGLLKILNFAHGHILMAGAYMFFYFHILSSFDLFSSAILTLLSALLASFITMRVFIEPFTRYSTILPFITTLALATILESLVSMLFGVNVRSLSTSTEIVSHELYGIFITPIQIIIVVSALLILGSIAFIIHFSSIGRRVRALSEFPAAAQSMGISRHSTNQIIFSVATLLSVYTGILIGYETSLQPTMGGNYTMKGFAAMVLGGLGNFWGTIAGSYILGLVENLGIGLDLGDFSLPAGYKDAFAYLIILVMLLVRPHGLFGKKLRSA